MNSDMLFNSKKPYYFDTIVQKFKYFNLKTIVVFLQRITAAKNTYHLM